MCLCIVERAPQGEIRARGPKIRFEKLLHAVAEFHGCKGKELTAPGRQLGVGEAAGATGLPGA
jgi:hypothetical protein